MEKVEIKLSIDEYQMRAMTYYLGKENNTVQKKMDESLRRLYEEAVHVNFLRILLTAQKYMSTVNAAKEVLVIEDRGFQNR